MLTLATKALLAWLLLKVGKDADRSAYSVSGDFKQRGGLQREHNDTEEDPGGTCGL